MIKAGEIITCPNPKCGRWLAKAKADIVFGTRIDAGLFESIGNLIVNGEPMVCSRCGWSYYYNGKLHTKDGWKP